MMIHLTLGTNNMTNLIIFRGGKMFTTTLAISEGINNDHNSVVLLLKKYSYLEDFSGIEFHKYKKEKGAGRAAEVAYLSELQATILITLMKNSPEVIDFKVKLAKAFFKQRKILQQIMIQKENEEWLIKRSETKVMRRECTDVIQEFIEYAKEQGSKSAEKYYMNFSRMELTGLFLIEQKYPSARDVMSIRQLNLIEMADEAVSISLKESMANKIPYKECYQIAKEKICLLAKIFPKSPLPLLLANNS